MSDRKIGSVARELIAAKKRIEDPENWCQGRFYASGRVCVRGAIHEVNRECGAIVYSDGSPKNLADVALNQSCIELFGSCSVGVNDDLGHEAVMQGLNHAIQRALSEGK